MKIINDFNIFKFTESYRENDSTFGHEGNEYDLNKIFDYVEMMPLVYINVDELDWILQYTDVYQDRIESADIEVPIIIIRYNDEWVVVDGVHRLSKMKSMDIRVAPTKIIPSEFISIWEI